MSKQIIFIITVFITLAVFSYTSYRLYSYFKLLKAFPIKNYRKRFLLMMKVAFGQTKIFRFPLIGFLHALVFWGFCVIIVGSIEMIVDGLFNLDKSLTFLGSFYNVITASGDIFALVIAIAIIIFIGRRAVLQVKRFNGIEMTHRSHIDAYSALSLIFLLMISLLGINTFYCAAHPNDMTGLYPVSKFLATLFSNMENEKLLILLEINWWFHILLIFFFANILPYSKHFHVFLSVPNVFLSSLEPLGKLPNMDNITSEVKMILNPQTSSQAAPAEASTMRFGVKDVEDINWKNYLDSLTCTQCGRCTSVCPANITGKKLSPRKLMMDVRARMKEKGKWLVKKGLSYTDNKSLNSDYFTAEEIWACTTCNACAKECPVNINHPTLIIDMRRYYVMEEGLAPSGLKTIFTNVENNGAPWQFSPEDRLLWAKDIQ